VTTAFSSISDRKSTFHFFLAKTSAAMASATAIIVMATPAIDVRSSSLLLGGDASLGTGSYSASSGFLHSEFFW
jgi:hypothetical protein